MFPPDTYSQRDAPDPVLEPATVLRIVRKHVQRAAAVTAVDETGGEARVYMVDDDVVLKTQRPQQLRASTSLAKEVAFLNALASEPEVNVPRVLGYGRDGDVEYTVMTRMPGVASRDLEIEGTSRADLLRSLGRMLRRIHSLPQQQFYENPLFPGVRTVAAFEERLRAGLERAIDRIEREPSIWRLSTAPRALVDRVLAAPRSQVDLVALHSNPGPPHVFVDPGTPTSPTPPLIGVGLDLRIAKPCSLVTRQSKPCRTASSPLGVSRWHSETSWRSRRGRIGAMLRPERSKHWCQRSEIRSLGQ